MIDFATLYSKTKNLSLLLAEDYKPLRDDMAEILEDLFLTVAVAADGREALQSYQTYYENHHQYFDLVMSDIQMPQMNGIELCEALYEINPKQKIIILSAHTDSDYLLRLINLGIAQFITKPIKQDELLNTLYTVTKKFDALKEQSISSSIIDLGKEHTWDSQKDILKYQKTIITLTHYELLLMRFLAENIETICTNEDILQNFYANDIDINESNIRNLIFKLRKKLPEKSIHSLYGMGYKLTTL